MAGKERDGHTTLNINADATYLFIFPFFIILVIKSEDATYKKKRSMQMLNLQSTIKLASFKKGNFPWFPYLLKVWCKTYVIQQQQNI